jgi:hypothetical protein
VDAGDELHAVELVADGHEAGRSIWVEVEAASSGFTQAISHGDSSLFGGQGLSVEQALEPELACAPESRSLGWVEKMAELGGGTDATAFEEAKAGAIGELEKADVYSRTCDMSWR